MNQFKPVFPASLNQFDPVNDGDNQYEQAHGKNWFEQFEPVLTAMSPWTAHAQPVRTGLSSVNQFKPVFPTSLNQFDDNLHYTAHAQKLVRTGFSSLNQFSTASLNQFDPVNAGESVTTLLMHKNW